MRKPPPKEKVTFFQLLLDSSVAHRLQQLPSCCCPSDFYYCYKYIFNSTAEHGCNFSNIYVYVYIKYKTELK